MKKEDVDLKVELLTRGARISREGWDSYKRSAGFQVYLNDLPVSIPAWGKYDRYKWAEASPFIIKKEDSKWGLYKEDEFLRELTVQGKPFFYNNKTTSGSEMWRVLHICGDQCLLTGVQQTCAYMKDGLECKFCGTIYNPRYEGRLDRKKPGELAEVAEAAFKEGIIDVMLSSGVTRNPDRGVLDVASAARAVKERIDVKIQAEVAVPSDVETLNELSGCVDSISLNIESLDTEVREKVCPGKSRISFEDYFRAFLLSLEIFGDNQVNSWIIAGIGESDESIIKGARRLAESGVYPFLVALRPTKYTAFENRVPPTPERLKRLSTAVAGIVKDAGLRPDRNKAGCARCSACSAVKDYARLL